jgi:MFS family permease
MDDECRRQAYLAFSSYLAYLIAEFPFGWLMQKFAIQKVLAYVVLGWGICVFGLAACNNFKQRKSIQDADLPRQAR